MSHRVPTKRFSSAGPVVARPSFVVRAEQGEAAAAPAKKPDIGPKRGTKVRHSGPAPSLFLSRVEPH